MKKQPLYKIRYIAPWWTVTRKGYDNKYIFIDWESALEMVKFMAKTDARLAQMFQLLK